MGTALAWSSQIPQSFLFLMSPTYSYSWVQIGVWRSDCLYIKVLFPRFIRAKLDIYLYKLLLFAMWTRHWNCVGYRGLWLLVYLSYKLIKSGLHCNSLVVYVLTTTSSHTSSRNKITLHALEHWETTRRSDRFTFRRNWDTQCRDTETRNKITRQTVAICHRGWYPKTAECSKY